MVAIVTQFDTLDFGATVKKLFMNVPSELEQQRVPDRFGSLVTVPPTLGARNITCFGRIKGTSVSDARDQVDSFMQVLGEGTRGKLYIWSDRYLNCYVEGQIQMTPVDGSGGTAFDYQVNFLGDDPFWYKDSGFVFTFILDAGSADATIDATNNVYRKDFTINHEGSAHVFPIITIKADQGTDLDQGVDLIHVGNNLTVAYSGGTISQGTIAKFDHGNHLVQNPLGTKDMNNVQNTSVFWWLESGDNTIRVEAQACTIGITFTPRWF